MQAPRRRAPVPRPGARSPTVACAAAAFLSFACGHGDGAPRVASPAAVSRAAPPAAAAAAPGRAAPPKETRAERTDAEVAEALAETARIRELPAKGVVRGVALSRQAMGQQVRSSIERQVPAEILAAESEVLVALGLVPVDFDYVGAVTKMMGDELAGYYEPADKTMYLAADLGKAAASATLSHELVHALQDQYYDLGRLLDYRPDESDLQSALHALAEGDATSAMLDQVLEPERKKATDLSDELVGVQVRAAAQWSSGTGNVPGVLMRSLIAPYTDGITFVHALRRKGGWAAVDRAWRAPPASTEQILHPEKFESGERPVVISPPEPEAKSGLRRTHTDVFGEQSVRVVLEEWLPRRVAVDAAAGWGGDRVAVFRDGDRVAVAWHVRYDDVAAARRGFDAFRRGTETQGTPRSTRDRACVERADRGPLLVARRDRDIAIVAGPYRHTAGAAAVAGSCASAEAWATALLSQP